MKQNLEKQGYRFTGNNSAVKICEWTKKSITQKGVCYKQKFYGINSHLCCQMTPNFVCPNQCIFCWRDMSAHTDTAMTGAIDNPDDIIEKAFYAQRRLLSGLGAKEAGSDPDKLMQSKNPIHFAISLTGEPTLYPKLNELIKKLHKKNFSTFVVSNGMYPNVIESLERPTQLYISLDAPNKTLFEEIDRPKIKDAWERLMQTLDIIAAYKTRTCLRLTIIKGINDINAEQWAELIERASPTFVEVKAYMFIGSSRLRLKIENMPRHPEVIEFAKEIEKHCSYKIIDEKKESRVALMAKEDYPWRIVDFSKGDYEEWRRDYRKN